MDFDSIDTLWNDALTSGEVNGREICPRCDGTGTDTSEGPLAPCGPCGSRGILEG
jgi:DnaJ-class molecular chaperone